MNYETAGIAVLWFFLYTYIILSSIDFGAGFLNFYSMAAGNKQAVRPVIERFLSPVWEVGNVFLIFFLFGMVGFFPKTSFYFGSAMLLPGSLAMLLFSIRGYYYSYKAYSKKDSRFLEFLYGTSGLLIPVVLAVVLTVSEGGFIEYKHQQIAMHYDRLFSSPYAWSVALLTLAAVLYIASMFLTYVASRIGDDPALYLFRVYSLVWSGILAGAVLLAFLTLRRHNPDHYERMLSLSWLFMLFLLCFLLAFYLIWSGKWYGFAFLLVMAQFAFLFAGYGAGHYPYLLYPYLTLEQTITSDIMAAALLVTFLFGLLVLIPSFVLLIKLYLFDGKGIGEQSR